MKGKKLAVLIFIIAIVIALAIFAGPWLAKTINLGLDLQGGVHIVYQAVGTEENPIDDDSITKAIAILDKRVNEFGVSEPIIQQEGDNRIIVEIAGIDDPEQAIEVLGQTALLEFKLEDGTTVLTGSDLKDAQESYDSTGIPEVSLEFTAEGSKKFAEVTTDNVKKTLGIYLDGVLLKAPTIEEPITGGTAAISGNFETLEDAHELAVLLRSGALPVSLEIMEKRAVGPTLGADSLDKSFNAAIVGLGLIFLFMIVYYRLPGLIANFSLVVYILIVLGVLSLIGATMTLPGIAGVLLSVAMAVDLNIIIFERLKEEIHSGKSLRSAINTGFKRALNTVIDSNVTTLIAAVVLYFCTSGSIKGFALTLIIGIVVSLFTAITFTRFMLHLLIDSKITGNVKHFGA